MLRFHMKAEAIPRNMCHRTIKSILTFNGVNRPRKIEKNHETSPKIDTLRIFQFIGEILTTRNKCAKYQPRNTNLVKNAQSISRKIQL